jgi:chitinase
MISIYHCSLAMVPVLLASFIGIATASASGSLTFPKGCVASKENPSCVQLPLPYAGTYYPIYNSGVGQWIEPTGSMPFDRVSTVYVAFAHAYPSGNGAILDFESGQPLEPQRLKTLLSVSRGVNPNIKVLISLGWEHEDWTYISNDYVNRTNLFVPSVVAFIRNNNLDGFDIDDEGIGYSSGDITQKNFNGVVANLRSALDAASVTDGKTYYFTITPAGNNQKGGIDETQVDSTNASNFDLINIQTYYPGSWGSIFLKSLDDIHYPKIQTANGIDTGSCKPGPFPVYSGYAGLFNWNFSEDSACENFRYTKEIANDVGY